MAYQPLDLSVIAYANGFTLWHYTTTDTATVVGTSGYFNDAADMLRVGDMILANTDTDGTPKAGILHVLSINSTAVEVDNLAKAP